MGGGYYPTNAVEGLAATAAFISFINVFGGFIVTARMLDMFKRPTDPPEYNYLYGIPGAAFLASYGWAVSQGNSLDKYDVIYGGNTDFPPNCDVKIDDNTAFSPPNCDVII